MQAICSEIQKKGEETKPRVFKRLFFLNMIDFWKDLRVYFSGSNLLWSQRSSDAITYFKTKIVTLKIAIFIHSCLKE